VQFERILVTEFNGRWILFKKLLPKDDFQINLFSKRELYPKISIETERAKDYCWDKEV